jgi:hypothetical protein
MAGESWRQSFQVGKETTEGTAVAATRKLYMLGDLKQDRPVNLIRVANGLRTNVVDARPRAIISKNSFTMQLSADEILEPLLMTVQGSVTPTTTLGASTWVFKPNTNNVDTATLEWYDGYRGWMANGCKGNMLKISSTVSGDVSVAWDVWARNVVAQTITPALTDRVPLYIEGWETKLYIDNFGGTAGTTAFAKCLSSEVTVTNNLGLKYYQANLNTVGDIPLGLMDIGCVLRVEGDAAGFAEYGNWTGIVKRLVRIEHGNNGAVLGTSALKPRTAIDIPGAWSVVDLSPEDNGTKVYQMTLVGIYDPGNGYGLQITTQTTRSAAWV